MLVEDGVHCIYDRQVDAELLVSLVDAVGAVVSFGYHLHLQLGGFDGVTHAYHLPELAVTAELGVGGNQYVAQVAAGIDVAMNRAEGFREELDLLQGVADQHGLEVIAVAQRLTYTSGNGVDVFHHGGVFESDDVNGVARAYVRGLEQRRYLCCAVAVGAADGQVTQALQGYLLSVARAGDDEHVVVGYVEALVQVFGDDLVLLGDHAFHGGDDDLLPHGTLDLLERRLEVGGGDSQDQYIRVAHYEVDVVREVNTAHIERSAVQIGRVLACALELLYYLRTADEPVDLIHVREHDLGECGSPTAAADNGDTFVRKHNMIYLASGFIVGKSSTS